MRSEMINLHPHERWHLGNVRCGSRERRTQGWNRKSRDFGGIVRVGPEVHAGEGVTSVGSTAGGRGGGGGSAAGAAGGRDAGRRGPRWANNRGGAGRNGRRSGRGAGSRRSAAGDALAVVRVVKDTGGARHAAGRASPFKATTLGPKFD